LDRNPDDSAVPIGKDDRRQTEQDGGDVAQDPPRVQATIEDVARRAGVSRAAVSKVLRNAYGVSPAMKERVGSAIAELGYRPRVAARAMRGASFSIGFEIPDFANPFFTKVLSGATRALAESQYQLIIAPADSGAMEGYRALEALVDRQVDGVVAVSPLVSQDWLERIAASTPVVMLGRHDHSAIYDTLAGDDAAGARAVMEHLIGLGHRQIVHLTRDEIVTVPGSGTPHSLRLSSYLECMAEAGLSDFVRVVRCGEGEEPPYTAMTELLGSGEVPTAVFAGHDELAIAALRAVAESGLEVSVAGYDNALLAGHPRISLTSVDQSGEQMGARAVEMLLERISGRSESLHEIVTPALVVRESTRPPASRPTRPRAAPTALSWKR
jgi:LacI family transcriptional regulator